jgi:decaprenylphospho-beta-D-ribofuranose 2-oxidase
MTRLSGWGRYPSVDQDVSMPGTADAMLTAMAVGDGHVARGNGRSYGDAALGARQAVSTLALDRFCSFDAPTGRLTVEAGVLLADIIATFLPRGYFPKVVPGTRFITVGGAIAADVHGKNHHRDGGFGDHVDSLVLAPATGGFLNLSRQQNPELFFATLGGMGLTGTIVEATLRLAPIETGWIRQKTVVAPDLDAALRALDEGDDATYSVAWIDAVAKGSALGRSLIFLGEHSRLDELDGKFAARRFPTIGKPRLSVPFNLPSLALNPWSVRGFNELYYRRAAPHAGAAFPVGLAPYFFPLDGIGGWNRIYGRRGFIQHQSVIPAATAPAALADLLAMTASRGDASFLAVLKKLGASHGLLSFPFPGYTLALDFPMKPGLLEFLETLDQRVVAAGGRLYLAKDARQSRATFEAGYASTLANFRDIRRQVDPDRRIRSLLSERLGI